LKFVKEEGIPYDILEIRLKQEGILFDPLAYQTAARRFHELAAWANRKEPA
jgi:hypothetical protein